MGDDNPWVGGILGHEAAGTVELVGDKVVGWQPGDRAVVALVLPAATAASVPVAATTTASSPTRARLPRRCRRASAAPVAWPNTSS